MFKQTLIAAAAIALFAAAATTPALAQSAGTPPANKAGAPRMYGYELMTPEERQAYMDKMRNAKTPEERTKLRDEHRAEMQKRAKEKGVTLSEPRGPRGPGGPGGARGQMYGEQLFSSAGARQLPQADAGSEDARGTYQDPRRSPCAGAGTRHGKGHHAL